VAALAAGVGGGARRRGDPEQEREELLGLLAGTGGRLGAGLYDRQTGRFLDDAAEIDVVGELAQVSR
jgi:hypothetical protein